jgi:hypothetical protein
MKVGGKLICRYIADFIFDEERDGSWHPVVADAKGNITPVYKLKKKLMAACLGIEIRNYDTMMVKPIGPPGIRHGLRLGPEMILRKNASGKARIGMPCYSVLLRVLCAVRSVGAWWSAAREQSWATGVSG